MGGPCLHVAVGRARELCGDGQPQGGSAARQTRRSRRVHMVRRARGREPDSGGDHVGVRAPRECGRGEITQGNGDQGTATHSRPGAAASYVPRHHLRRAALKRQACVFAAELRTGAGHAGVSRMRLRATGKAHGAPLPSCAAKVVRLLPKGYYPGCNGAREAGCAGLHEARLQHKARRRQTCSQVKLAPASWELQESVPIGCGRWREPRGLGTREGAGLQVRDDLQPACERVLL
mmetsp:Transcript_62588/g.150932  ORF Transcript_62588/g.150932 Transcript_62588/m.150932 type:complete len:234 (-) Transcript_62588:143-844(-)